MLEPQLQKLEKMTAAHVYSLNQPPEEEALTKITQYAATNGLSQQTSRLFGRNIYLTDQSEPHGYEYYLTVDGKTEPNGEFEELPGGLYAVLEVANLFSLTEGWKNLFSWVEANGHIPVGVKKGSHGWVNSAYEELLDWQQQKPPTEWRFRLWVQLRQ